MTVIVQNPVYVDEAGVLFVKFEGHNWIKITMSGSAATKVTTVVPVGELLRVHIDNSGHIYKHYQGRLVSIGTTHAIGNAKYHLYCTEALALTKYVDGQYLPATYVA